jgi:hypothetical protein
VFRDNGGCGFPASALALVGLCRIMPETGGCFVGYRLYGEVVLGGNDMGHPPRSLNVVICGMTGSTLSLLSALVRA